MALCDTQQFESEVKRHFWRNYLANSIEGGIYIGGMAFLSAETVLPTMVHSLGGPDWLIALMPVMSRLGFVLPPLFTAHIVERWHRMKPFVVILSFFQRLPFLVAGLVLLLMGTSHPMLALMVAAFAPFLSGFFGGVSLGAWMEMVTKVIPPNRRASSWAIRYTITAVLGLIAGYVISEVLARYPGARGYGILYLIVTLFVFISYVVFLLIKEPPLAPKEEEKTRSLRDNLRSLPTLLKGDVRFRNYVMCRILGMGVFIILPFLPIYACATCGRGPAFVGILTMAQMIGAIVGNIVAAYVGDRSGGKALLIASRLIFLLAFGAAMACSSATGFALIYVCYGLALNLDRVGASTLSIEIFPQGRRPTYYSLLMFITFPTMLIISGLATVIHKYSPQYLPALGNFMPGLVLALVTVALSTVFLIRVPEPRREN